MGLIKMLINTPSFDLRLTVGPKCVFLSVTPPNHFYAYSLDKSLHFVHFYVSECFLSIFGHFMTVLQKIVVIVIYGRPSL